MAHDGVDGRGGAGRQVGSIVGGGDCGGSFGDVVQIVDDGVLAVVRLRRGAVVRVGHGVAGVSVGERATGGSAA